jgi:hypothetical protein
MMHTDRDKMRPRANHSNTTATAVVTASYSPWPLA